MGIFDTILERLDEIVARQRTFEERLDSIDATLKIMGSLMRSHGGAIEEHDRLLRQSGIPCGE